jgi:hypothetical protein
MFVWPVHICRGETFGTELSTGRNAASGANTRTPIVFLRKLLSGFPPNSSKPDQLEIKLCVQKKTAFLSSAFLKLWSKYFFRYILQCFKRETEFVSFQYFPPNRLLQLI